MKILTAAAFILALSVATGPVVAYAQSNNAPVPGAQPVPGEGPGGSGAGQSTKGAAKDMPGTASDTMMKKPDLETTGSVNGGAMKTDGTKMN